MSFFGETPEPPGGQPGDVYEHFAALHVGARTVDEWGVTRGPDGWVFPRPDGVMLLGAERVEATSDQRLVLAADETELLALWESGVRNVVAIPRSARGKALAQHADLLADAKRIVLACRGDRAGVVVREELARRLGRHRCWLVAWPEGCSCACDVLGTEHDLARIVADAEPYPIEGMQHIKPLSTLLELRHRPAPEVLTTGARATDFDHDGTILLRFPGEGRIIVITGVPSHGKSVWAAFVMIHLMRHHERKFMVFSPEMDPWEEYVAHCAAVWCGKPFRDSQEAAGMTDEEIIAAEKWLAPKLQTLTAGPMGDAPTLDWFIERASAAVLRDGATDVVMDPWNELEHSHHEVSETKYIGRSLQRLRGFARAYGCNVWIIAHPTKLRPARPGDPLAPPGLYDISDSSHWANKADLGITVHTPSELTEIHVIKSRFRRWGRRGKRALLEFDKLTGRFSDPKAAPASPPHMREPLPHWSDKQ